MLSRLLPRGDSVRWLGPADLRGTEGFRVGGCRARDRARHPASAGAPAGPPAPVPRVHAPERGEAAGQSTNRGENVRTRRRTCLPCRPPYRSGDSVQIYEPFLTYEPPYARVTTYSSVKACGIERTLQAKTAGRRESFFLKESEKIKIVPRYFGAQCRYPER